MGSGPSAITAHNNGSSSYSDVIGQVKTIRMGHTWSLGNFRVCCKRKATGETVVSPIFFTGTNNRYKWRLVLYPQGDNEQNRDYVSLYLQLVADGDENLAVKTSFSLALINATGEEVNKFKPSKRHCFLKGQTLWGYGRFISRAEIIDVKNQLLHGNVKNARLTVLCENSNSESTDDVPAECNLLHVAICNNLLKVSRDFEALMQNRQLSDFTIIASNGEEFHVHRAILAARSPVFAAMFEHDTKERTENIVVIEDIRRDIVVEMLRYVYSGRVVDLENIVHELLAAADRYALDDLKGTCEEVLYNGLNVANAVELLIFADAFNARKLKTRVHSFIIKHSKSVAETQGFKSAMDTHPHLIAEMFQEMAMQH